MAVPDAILDKIPHLPESPGVYLWRDADGQGAVRGQGEAAALARAELRRERPRESVKTRALMQQAAALETIVVPSEAHALILEANLIKEYRPRFNIALRDDKSYPYIKVTVQEPFPRVWVTRRLQNDGARYFGPYTDVGAMRRALNVVKRIFTVRSCNYDMPKQMPERPCLDYHIGRCKAPCILAQTQGEYAAMIDEVLVFLDGQAGRGRAQACASGWSSPPSRSTSSAPPSCATRSRISSRWRSRRSCMEVEGGDRDVIGYARDGDDAVVALHAHPRRQAARARAPVRREHRRARRDADVLEAYLAGTYSPARGARARAAASRSTSRSASWSRSRSSARRSTCRSAVRAASWSSSRSRTRGTCSRSCGSPARRPRSARAIRSTSCSGSSDCRRCRAPSCASTSRTRRAPTPSRRASGSRTAGRIAPSIASSR